jgi:hypothetical protein
MPGTGISKAEPCRERPFRAPVTSARDVLLAILGPPAEGVAGAHAAFGTGAKSMTLDWKWIGIGVALMLVLTVIAGLLLGVILASSIEGATAPEEIQFSGGQIALAGLLNFLAFAIGGFIVGLKSSGRTILEPGISAAIAVLIGLLISGNFSVLNIIAGGLVPFAAGMLGGWLGEKRQGTV